MPEGVEDELGLKDFKIGYTTLGDHIKRILDMPVKVVNDVEALSKLEQVSGYSIEKLTKLFAEGKVLCEKEYVDNLINDILDLKAKAYKAYAILHDTYQIENGNLPTAMEEAIGYLGEILE
jgi:hypothetical protein